MNKRGEGRYSALLVFLVCLIIFGIGVPAFVGQFQDVSLPNTASAVYGIVSFMSGTITIDLLLFDIDLGIFSLLPDSLEEYVHQSLYSFTFLPDLVSVPLFLFMGLSLLYVVITLIPTVGG